MENRGQPGETRQDERGYQGRLVTPFAPVRIQTDTHAQHTDQPLRRKVKTHIGSLLLDTKSLNKEDPPALCSQLKPISSRRFSKATPDRPSSSGLDSVTPVQWHLQAFTEVASSSKTQHQVKPSLRQLPNVSTWNFTVYPDVCHKILVFRFFTIFFYHACFLRRLSDGRQVFLQFEIQQCLSIPIEPVPIDFSLFSYIT